MSWFSKKEIKQPQDNIYTVINKELARLHKQMQQSMGTYHQPNKDNTNDNATLFLRRIEKLEDALLEALEKQPSHHEEIKDLQETVADIVLLGENNGPADV